MERLLDHKIHLGMWPKEGRELGMHAILIGSIEDRRIGKAFGMSWLRRAILSDAHQSFSGFCGWPHPTGRREFSPIKHHPNTRKGRQHLAHPSTPVFIPHSR